MKQATKEKIVRFVKWIIGYKELPYPIVIEREAQPILLKAEYAVCSEYDVETGHLEEFLYIEIAKELRKHKLLKTSFETSRPHTTYIMRGELVVMPPTKPLACINRKRT